MTNQTRFVVVAVIIAKVVAAVINEVVVGGERGPPFRRFGTAEIARIVVESSAHRGRRSRIGGAERRLLLSGRTVIEVSNEKAVGDEALPPGTGPKADRRK